MTIKALFTWHEPRLQTPRRKASVQPCLNSLHSSKHLLETQGTPPPKIPSSKVQPTSHTQWEWWTLNRSSSAKAEDK